MAMQYVGRGSYIHGVPARDLSDAEEKQHKQLIDAQQKATGVTLYVKVKKAEDKPAIQESEE